MSFIIKNITVLSHANGFTHWHYTTRDNLSDVVAFNYFLAVKDMMKKGDLITVNAENASAFAFVIECTEISVKVSVPYMAPYAK